MIADQTNQQCNEIKAYYVPHNDVLCNLSRKIVADCCTLIKIRILKMILCVCVCRLVRLHLVVIGREGRAEDESALAQNSDEWPKMRRVTRGFVC